MALLALLLVIIALPFAIFDQRIAIACLVTGAALAGWALLRGRWLWLGRSALVFAVVGALLIGWEIWELRRPASQTSATAPTGQPDAPDREVWLPLTVEIAPITRLALLEFAPDADPIFAGLEPQFIDRGSEQGFRVIAYRHDGHVDIYDEPTLTPEPDEGSRVTGSGRLNYRQTDLGEPLLEVDAQGRVHIEFAFVDVTGRQVSVRIHESSTRASVPLNLLAPVGLSATDPEYFPLFLMRDFEFIRLGGELDVRIEDASVELAPFPVSLPVQEQPRSFAKYSLSPEITTVFPAADEQLRRVTTTGDCYGEAASSYCFEGNNLAHIIAGSTEIVFAPALDLTQSGTGTITMTSHPELGRIAGTYQVATAAATSRLTIEWDEVEVPRQRGLLYRLIVNDGSMFAAWPKHYRYEAAIDLTAQTIDARWENLKPGG